MVKVDENAPEFFKQFVAQANNLSDLDLKNVLNTLAIISMSRWEARMARLKTDDGVVICIAQGPEGVMLSNGYDRVKNEVLKNAS